MKLMLVAHRKFADMILSVGVASYVPRYQAMRLAESVTLTTFALDYYFKTPSLRNEW
jgi:hypothetical protein